MKNNESKSSSSFSIEEIDALLSKGVNKRLAMSVLVEKNGSKTVSESGDEVPKEDQAGSKSRPE